LIRGLNCVVGITAFANISTVRPYFTRARPPSPPKARCHTDRMLTVYEHIHCALPGAIQTVGSQYTHTFTGPYSKVGVIYGNPEITTGGNALKFYASVRLDIRRKEVIKVRR